MVFGVSMRLDRPEPMRGRRSRNAVRFGPVVADGHDAGFRGGKAPGTWDP